MTAILLAYALASFSVLSADDISYQLLNLVGATGILIISLHKHVMQTVVLNAVWISVAVIALLGILV